MREMMHDIHMYITRNHSISGQVLHPAIYMNMYIVHTRNIYSI